MTTNLTMLFNADSVVDLVRFVNVESGDIFTPLVILGMFFIMLYSLRKEGMTKALGISSFSVFIVSMFFSAAGMINFTFVLLFLSITAFSAFYMYVVE